MILADASALIAIIAGEDDADALTDTLGADSGRLCSAVSVWETGAGLCRSYAFSVPSARERVARFPEAGGFRFAEIGVREARLATEAYAHYGKGRRRAALNMGDCFACACAKANRAKLLHKGEDFSETDLA